MRTIHAVQSITADDRSIDFSGGQLIVDGDPPDFELSFQTSTPLTLATVDLVVVTADGLRFAGQGVDATGDPWRHRLVNGLGVPRWLGG